LAVCFDNSKTLYNSASSLAAASLGALFLDFEAALATDEDEGLTSVLK